jgi:hypothetical protein
VGKTAAVQGGTPDGLARAGDVVVFVTTATNTGSTTLTDVVITDVDDPTSCTAATLEPGRSVTCTVRHTTTAADVRRGRVLDRATALAWSPSGYVVGGDASTQATTVPTVPPLAMTGADVVHPAGAAAAAIILGSLLAWAGASLRVSSGARRPVE